MALTRKNNKKNKLGHTKKYMFVLCTLECVPYAAIKNTFGWLHRDTLPPSLETVNCQKCHPVSRFLQQSGRHRGVCILYIPHVCISGSQVNTRMNTNNHSHVGGGETYHVCGDLSACLTTTSLVFWMPGHVVSKKRFHRTIFVHHQNVTVGKISP